MNKEISRRDFITKLAGATALAGCSIGAGLFFHNRRLVPESAALKSVQSFAVAGTENPPNPLPREYSGCSTL